MPNGIKIIKLEPDGPLARAGLRVGDRLRRVNGHDLADSLDFLFRAAEPGLRLEWTDATGHPRRGAALREYGQSAGVDFAPFRHRACRNKCPFCFIDQLPKGLRRALYFKDEDYRLSFLYGHYITGANLRPADLDRIANYRLSPLYLSIHATEPELRKRLLGRRTLEPIAHLLDFLRDAGIEIHAQIVLCPGWNDGPHLTQTLSGLRGYWPTLQSVAIVPVGLTGHRHGLPEIKPVTPAYARRLIDELRPLQRRWKRELGESLIHLSDEFYLKAKTPLPTYRADDELPQLENGVGMIHRFLHTWKRAEKKLPAALPERRRIGVITGKLAAPILRPLIQRLNRIQRLSVKLLPVENRLFGKSVTVSGLLPGRDILHAIQAAPPRDVWLIPANALRPWDDLFLDNLSLTELSAQIGAPIHAIPNDATALAHATLQASATSPPNPEDADSHEEHSTRHLV